MKLIYTGRSDAATIAVLDVTVNNGDSVDVPADIADSLLTSGQWTKATTTTRTRSANDADTDSKE